MIKINKKYKWNVKIFAENIITLILVSILLYLFLEYIKIVLTNI